MESARAYEAAFEAWLSERRIPYQAIPQGSCFQSGGARKRFDYLLRPEGPLTILAEVKGRMFAGVSLAGRRGLDGWTTRQDLLALKSWEEMFVRHSRFCRAVFVFVFYLKQPDVDPDGLEIFEQNGRRYVFFVLEAKQYQVSARQRSPKWGTVTLKSDDFRRYAVPLNVYLENIWNESGY
jgi:hypothetical protein